MKISFPRRWTARFNTSAALVEKPCPLRAEQDLGCGYDHNLVRQANQVVVFAKHAVCENQNGAVILLFKLPRQHLGGRLRCAIGRLRTLIDATKNLELFKDWGARSLERAEANSQADR